MRLLTHVRGRFGRALGVRVPTSPVGVERRRPTRLKDGTRRPCPGCGGTIEFREIYQIWRVGRNTREPAWVCQTAVCAYREFVRA